MSLFIKKIRYPRHAIEVPQDLLLYAIENNEKGRNEEPHAAQMPF